MEIKTLFLITTILTNILTHPPKIVGHNGSSKGVPSSVEAYKSGITDYSYDGIHGVLKITKDGKYIISNDSIIRTKKGSKTIHNTDFQTLKNTQIIHKTDDKITVTICTLQEFLHLCKKNNVFPVIELRMENGLRSRDMSSFTGVMDLIRKNSLENKVIFTSHIRPILEYIKENYYNIKVFFLSTRMNDQKIKYVKKKKIATFVHVSHVNESFVREMKEVNLEVGVWGVKNREKYIKCAELGVDVVSVSGLKKNELPFMDNTNKKEENKSDL